MKHTAFFGDGEKTFALTTPMIHELERKTGHGVLAIYSRLRMQQAGLNDITETIRCALIGGGTEPREAAELVYTYAENRPLGESLGLAITILSGRFFGEETNSQDETGQADLSEDEADADDF